MINILSKGKSSFESNLIFSKSVLYLTDSPPFIVSISFLISFQSFLYIPNTFLFFFVKAKTSIYFHFLQ